MTTFSRTTAFRLVRDLAVEPSGTAMYLLVYAPEMRTAIEEDLRAEVQVQLGVEVRIDPVSAEGLTTSNSSMSHLRILRIDQWFPALITLLDTHVVRIEKMNIQFLFLVSENVYEQLLASAPNFRSRLTDIVQIVSEDSAGGAGEP
jgi:hypothetical protein